MTANYEVRRAVELDDLAALRRYADAGNADAAEALVEIAEERTDIDELRRLTATGNAHAAEVLADLTDD